MEGDKNTSSATISLERDPPPEMPRTIKITKEELTDMILGAPANSTKKQLETYSATAFNNTILSAQANKPLPSAYQLFCFEKRTEITEKLSKKMTKKKGISNVEHNKKLFVAVTKELSVSWASCKKDPQYSKESEWYNTVLEHKIASEQDKKKAKQDKKKAKQEDKKIKQEDKKIKQEDKKIKQEEKTNDVDDEDSDVDDGSEIQFQVREESDDDLYKAGMDYNSDSD